MQSQEAVYLWAQNLALIKILVAGKPAAFSLTPGKPGPWPGHLHPRTFEDRSILRRGDNR